MARTALQRLGRDTFEVLHRADMGGRDCQASVAVSDGQLFIRTDHRLFCIGRRKSD